MSGISAPFIGRPVATSLLAVAMILLGLLGYRLLPVSALPQVDFPTIQVTTRLPGASAETMTALVTAPLERQLGLIPGLSTMTSTSTPDLSAITLQFDLSKNIDIASEDVQAAINAAKGVLPVNLPYPPVYAKVNPADAPIITLALLSDTVPLTQLNDLADTLLGQKLSQLSGVGRVQIQGGQRPAFRIQLDPARLNAVGLTMDDVRTTLVKANVALPKGGFDGNRQSLTIEVNDQIASVEDYRRLILAWGKAAPVRLQDVGDVVEGVENARVAGTYNNHPAVLLEVLRQPGANIVETAERVKELLPRLGAAIPAGVKVEIFADRTHTIRAAVNDVQFTLILTVVLVILVIWLFLRSGRATVIPGVALPLSLIMTFGVMQFFGFSLDSLSLMALTIASGFVVDDAIVMIENIVRHIESGMKPLQAAYRGAREIGFTIISLTVSLIAVFIPLLFMSGIIGRLFREFALVLTVAVIASALVSLTLTPMMCGWMLKSDARHDEQGGRFYQALLRLYEQTLRLVMQMRGLTLLVALGTLLLTIALYIGMPKGFLPPQDSGMIIATTDARPDISFSALKELQDQVAAQALADPDVAGVASFIGTGSIGATPNSGQMTIALKPQEKRNSSGDTILRRLTERLNQHPGLTVHLRMAQDIQISARPSRTQYQYTLAGVDLESLALWAPKIQAALSALPQLAGLASDQLDGGAQLFLKVDRDAAMRLGVTQQAIDDTLYDSFGQRQISTFYTQANQYRVVLERRSQAGAPARRLLEDLYVKSAGGKLVPLSALVSVREMNVPLLISHEDQFPAVTLSFNLAPGVSLGRAMDAIAAAERTLEVPDTITRSFSGDAAEFRAALDGEVWLILAAMLVIYIVLGVLYESTIHPLTILSTLPSAGVGALLALALSGHDLTLIAIIGIILLMGIVKKNAIMMIDFALAAERDQGMTAEQAIFTACLLRFRPIMMTTMAALLGALPLAFDFGTGGEMRRPLGMALVGGLLLSQLLTLYTTPVIYLTLDQLKRRLTGRGAADSTPPLTEQEHAG